MPVSTVRGLGERVSLQIEPGPFCRGELNVERGQVVGEFVRGTRAYQRKDRQRLAQHISEPQLRQADPLVRCQRLRAVEAANDSQKRVLVDKVVARFGEDLQGRSFALWGLAFKPDTDDMREAPSRVIVHELLRRGAAIRAYDPVAMDEARRVFGDLPGLSFASHQADALRDADALLIVTEWRAFKSPDFEQMRALLKQPLIFDGRNLFDPALVRSLGLEYHAIGRGEA